MMSGPTSVSQESMKRINDALNQNATDFETLLRASKDAPQDFINEMKFLYGIISLLLSDEELPTFIPEDRIELDSLFQKPEFVSLVEAVAHQEGRKDWSSVITFAGFRQTPPSNSTYDNMLERDVWAQVVATHRSWIHPFLGNAHQALEDHVYEHAKLRDRNGRKIYDDYLTVVQSSGMGKSRLLDEFSKTHFTIPVNLRKPEARGFPPSDAKVHFFLRAHPERYLERVQAFLIALFEMVTEMIRRLNFIGIVAPQELSAAFREFMSDGQTMGGPGARRQRFYSCVIANAEKLIPYWKEPPSRSQNHTRLVKSLQALRQSIYKDPSPIVSTIPEIYLTFDEFHALRDTDRSYSAPKDFRLLQLREVLDSLSSLPLFSFFISTDPGIAPSCYTTGIRKPLPPFVDMGFHQLLSAHRAENDNPETLSDAAKSEHVVLYGRPLFGTRYLYGGKYVQRDLVSFAMTKILCEAATTDMIASEAQALACIALRIPLRLRTLTKDDNIKEQTLVEKHLRVILQVNDTIESMVTVSPAEPLLAQTSSIITRGIRRFHIPYLLMLAQAHYNVIHDDRGELIVAALLIMARDAAAAYEDEMESAELPIISVPSLLSNLFQADISTDLPSVSVPGEEHIPFDTRFSQTGTTFCYFSRPPRAVVSAPNLVAHLLRGGAILSATDRRGFMFVIPFCFNDQLDCSNVSFIICNVFNEPLDDSPDPDLFAFMNPYDLDIFTPDFQLPIIRIIFDLSATTPSLTRITHASEEAARSQFTSYDYWCAGMSPEVLKPIHPVYGDVWADLLRRSRPWEYLCDARNPEDAAARRSQMPGAGTHPDHWRWADVAALAAIPKPPDTVCPY